MKTSIIRFLLFLVTLSQVSVLYGEAAAPPIYGIWDQVDASLPLAVVGDTQSTLWTEKLIGRETNDREREKILGFIAGKKPGLVVHLGDVVNKGSDTDEWLNFDKTAEPIRANGIPMFPVVGNHDYWGNVKAAMNNLHARFPHLAQEHWAFRKYGDLGLIWLDSNKDELGESKWLEQAKWLEAQLAGAEIDPLIRGILVFAHHPPLTNSSVTSDEQHVKDAFLRPFLASRKALAFISGHAHTYERFNLAGKTFLVSGGGGGPRVKLLSGAKARHTDLCSLPSPRPFNYLMISQDIHGLNITVYGLEKDGSEEAVIERFLISWAIVTGPLECRINSTLFEKVPKLL